MEIKGLSGVRWNTEMGFATTKKEKGVCLSALSGWFMWKGTEKILNCKQYLVSLLVAASN